MTTTDKRKIPFYNRIFFRLYGVFSILLTIFSVLLGVVFTELYKESTTDVYVAELTKRAESIANQISIYAIERDLEGYQSFMEAVAAMEDFGTTDVWVLSKKKADEPLRKNFRDDIRRSEMADGMKKVVRRAFRDKVTYGIGYDEIYERETLWLAAPIRDTGANVIGAVLLNADGVIQTNRYRLPSPYAGQLCCQRRIHFFHLFAQYIFQTDAQHFQCHGVKFRKLVV